MSMTVHNKDGFRIHSSRNLRGLLDHARRSPVKSVQLAETFKPGEYVLETVHDDGSFTTSLWADWRIAADWIKARRSWAVEQVYGYAPFVNRLRGV